MDGKDGQGQGQGQGQGRAALVALIFIILIIGRARGDDVELDADRAPATKTHGSVLVRGATVFPGDGPAMRDTDVLVVAGKIRAIGRALEAPADVVEIDGRGRFVTPGAIDCHSHIAIEGGINEMAEKLSCEVRIKDEVNPEDVSIYRAAAGGTTTAHLLHGSGNPIGGQDAVIKLRWGKKDRAELLLEGAPQGVKFALGENVIRGDGYPRSRLAVESTLRRSFLDARAYAKTWRDYDDAKKRGENPAPPRRDLRLEALQGIVEGRIRIHCHCYREDEMRMLLRVCEEFGVKVAALHHALEAYKITDAITRHGCGVSTFSDWWAYKIEAFDAIPGNAGLSVRAGIVTSVNSDSAELIRHLFLEAAKSMRYGELDEVEALRLCTASPARQIGIFDKVGSLELGKDGDLVVWNGHPLSGLSHPVLTIVDGEVVFERREARDARPRDFVPFAPVRGDPIPPAPPASASGRYAIKAALVLPVSGPPIERATIVIDRGKIAAVARDAPIPDGATVIDGDFVVAPALWDASTVLGLAEIGSLGETNDARDPGDISPEVVALTAVHPASEHFGVTRIAGVGLALAMPTGGLIPGQASVIRTAGLSNAELDVAPTVALVVNWPSRPAAPPDGGERPKTWPRREQLETFIKEAKRDLTVRDAARARGETAPEPNPRLEAMAPYLRRERPVLFRADDARDVADAVAFAESIGVKPIVLGGRDAWRLAKTLGEKSIPVIYGPVLELPARREDPYDACYGAPAKLDAAGVPLAIRTGPGAFAGPRNLPFEAIWAASYGLPHARALESVTLAPARLFGLDKDRGSIDVGKSADLVVSRGDPLEPTSRTAYLFLDGKPVDLSSKQSRLYELFRARIDAAKHRANGDDGGR